MSSLVRIVLVLVLLIIVGGAAALAMWDAPVSVAKIEKVIPDDRFQH